MPDNKNPPFSKLMSEENEENESAFKVLNQDNLPLSIAGEAIFKPFGTENQKQKPNVFVLPMRRLDSINHQKDQNNPKTLEHENSLINDGNEIDKNFTKILDAKLRKLQRQTQKAPRRSPNQTKKWEKPRKPFITVVKKGYFLDPPPEIASLLGLPTENNNTDSKDVKQLYAYASKPKILERQPIYNQIGHLERCEAAAKAAMMITSSVAGIHKDNSPRFKRDVNSNFDKTDGPVPYANLMFERRIHRGSNYAPQPMQTGEGESAAARAAEARRRALARRKAQKQQFRSAELRLGSPPPVPGRRHEPVQTDKFLEELWNDPPMIDTCTQTDLFLDRPISPVYVPAKTGADAETQIYPGDLFDFDLEVIPILEVLVGKTIEQSLIEVLEEEELAHLREQQRRFLELRAVETAEAQRLAEEDMRLRDEKDRRMRDHEEGLRIQKEMEERIAASVLMQGYMVDLLPDVLEGLENEGFLTDKIKTDVTDSFIPWLMKEVTHELQEMVASRDVLCDLVKEILENRADMYMALYAEHPPLPEPEEEGTVMDEDVYLREHLKLQSEIMKSQAKAADDTDTQESPKQSPK